MKFDVAWVETSFGVEQRFSTALELETKAASAAEVTETTSPAEQ
jgi:hypothetical protein